MHSRENQPHDFVPKTDIYPKSCAVCRRVEDFGIHHGLTMQQATEYQRGIPLAEIRRKAALIPMEERCRRLGI